MNGPFLNMFHNYIKIFGCLLQIRLQIQRNSITLEITANVGIACSFPPKITTSLDHEHLSVEKKSNISVVFGNPQSH